MRWTVGQVLEWIPAFAGMTDEKSKAGRLHGDRRHNSFTRSFAGNSE
jgi:hypothetical protein